MNETKIVKSVVRDTPDLWIERLVIFSDLRQKTVLQDIPFKRGLNIIWGVSEPAKGIDVPVDSFLVGHSLAKLAFAV